MNQNFIDLFKKSKVPIKDNIAILKDIFTPDILNKIYNDLVNSQKWGFLQTSNARKEETKFWITILGGYLKKANTLMYNPFYEKELFDKIIYLIEPFLKQKYENQEIEIIPMEIYANGQTKGQIGKVQKSMFLYFMTIVQQ